MANPTTVTTTTKPPAIKMVPALLLRTGPADEPEFEELRAGEATGSPTPAEAATNTGCGTVLVAGLAA
jgi:hypothetical protein